MKNCRVIEKREFIGGALKGLVVDYRTFDRHDIDEANTAAHDRKGCAGGGQGFGSPYIVLDAWVEVES